MSEVIKNRYDFVFMFDVKDGNPNGDPDQVNLPRVDAEDQHSINVCRNCVGIQVIISRGARTNEEISQYTVCNDSRRLPC